MKNKKLLVALISGVIASGVWVGNASATEGMDDAMILERLGKMREEAEKNSVVEKVKKPKSICVGEAVQNVQNFFNEMIPDVCSKIDTDPDVEGSKYKYENPDGGCDIGLRMPGLPDFGFSAEGFDFCALAKAVTSDMVDEANSKMREELNTALDSVKDATGLDDFNLELNANDIATGEQTGVEDI